MLQSRTARWVTATALVCAVMVAAAYFVLVGPRRAEAAELAEQDVAAQQANDLLDIKVGQLKAQYAKLPESRAELAGVSKQIPAKAEMPALVRKLQEIAGASGVRLDGVTPGPAQYLGSAGGGVPPAPPGQAGTVAAIPLTIMVSGDYFQSVVFVRKLQSELSRLVLITGLELADSTTAGQGGVQLTISGSTFALPQSSTTVRAPAAGRKAAPGKPSDPMGDASAATATPVPSSTGSPSPSPSSTPTSTDTAFGP